MTEEIISLRINSELKQKMKSLDYINWSALIRNAIESYLESEAEFNKEIAKRASEKMNLLRKSKAFSKGTKTGTDIIREWRNKRK